MNEENKANKERRDKGDNVRDRSGVGNAAENAEVSPVQAGASEGPHEAQDESALCEGVADRDRDAIERLKRAIDNPATSAADRAEYREELGGLAMGYLDIFDEDEEREYAKSIWANPGKPPV